MTPKEEIQRIALNKISDFTAKNVSHAMAVTTLIHIAREANKQVDALPERACKSCRDWKRCLEGYKNISDENKCPGFPPRNFGCNFWKELKKGAPIEQPHSRDCMVGHNCHCTCANKTLEKK